MAYRYPRQKLLKLLEIFESQDRLLVLFMPDPDAISSAWALKRLLRRRLQGVDIAAVRPITRSDNLAMVRLLHIPIKQFSELNLQNYTKLALVDSQPHHLVEVENLEFDVVIDHHPVTTPLKVPFCDINPDYGATATLMTEYLKAARVKPSTYLATALFYGIKTDTHNFVLGGIENDIQAFRYLFNFVNQTILRKIETSELSIKNLVYFKKAFSAMEVNLKKHRVFLFLGKVDSADICVILADFMLKIYEISWSIVSAIVEDTVIIIFRTDGYRRNAGSLAANLFGELGKAGGHKEMARAEIPIKNIFAFLKKQTQSEIKAFIKKQLRKAGL